MDNETFGVLNAQKLEIPEFSADIMMKFALWWNFELLQYIGERLIRDVEPVLHLVDLVALKIYTWKSEQYPSLLIFSSWNSVTQHTSTHSYTPSQRRSKDAAVKQKKGWT